MNTERTDVISPDTDIHNLARTISREARRWHDLSWALESALSGQRKAATVDRAGPHGVSGATGRYEHGGRPLTAAAFDALRALREAGIPFQPKAKED